MRTFAVWLAVAGSWVAVAAADGPPVPPPPPVPPLPAPPPNPSGSTAAPLAPTPAPIPGPDHVPTPSGPDHVPATPPLPPPAPPPTPPPPPPPPPVPEAPLSASSLGAVGKRHNIELARDRLAVQLSVPANLEGERGNFVWVAVQFFDETGAPIKSEIPEAADSEGNVKFTTQTAYVALDHERLNFAFLIPYGVFPKRQPGRYKVEARLRLVERRFPHNRPLATATTTFFVEG